MKNTKNYHILIKHYIIWFIWIWSVLSRNSNFDIDPTLSAECGRWTWNGGSPQLYKVISKQSDHQSLIVACLMVARPSLPHASWSCCSWYSTYGTRSCSDCVPIGHEQYLANHLFALNTSDVRLTRPLHSFTQICRTYMLMISWSWLQTTALWYRQGAVVKVISLPGNHATRCP